MCKRESEQETEGTDDVAQKRVARDPPSTSIDTNCEMMYS